MFSWDVEDIDVKKKKKKGETCFNDERCHQSLQARSVNTQLRRVCAVLKRSGVTPPT